MNPAGNSDDMIPVGALLTRVFPMPKDSGTLGRIVSERIFKPRKDLDSFVLPEEIDWEADDRRVDRNWRMQLQGWMMFGPVMNVFDAGTEKDAAVEYFLATLADWWRHYGTDADDIVTSRMPESYAWYDMSVGFRALILSFFLNRIQHYALPLTTEQQLLLDRVARKHIRHLAYPQVFSLNNHGIFQMHGLVALTKTVADPQEFVAERDYATSRMVELLETQFDRRGIHREHSPHYHFYAVKMFSGAIQSGWYEDIPAFTERMAMAVEAEKWLVDPRRRPICVGDSCLTEQKRVVFPQETGPEYILSDFDASGYAVLRSGWTVPAKQASMVFLMGGYHTTTHKHRDCLSFDWFDKGRRIICDGGKYGYKSDIYRHYALSYAAHNNIQFDGFDIIKMAPYGSAIQEKTEQSDGIFTMTAALRMKAITHIRRLHIRPGHWILIEDEIAQARSRKITQRWHLDSDFHLQQAGDCVVRAVTEDGQGVTVEALGWSPKMTIHRGDTDPVQGYSFRKDLVLEPALAIAYSDEVKDARLLTVISLSESDRRDAKNYCRSRFGLPEVPSEALPKLTTLLPNIPHKVIGDGQEPLLTPGGHTYTMLAAGLALSFHATVHPTDPRRLLVLLPGASGRRRGHLDFQRHTWASDYQAYDVVSFSDPSLKPENDIGLAWFQNSADQFGIDALSEAITRICKAGNYAEQNMIIMGSSGGGFAALMLAKRFPAARIIAINPQINLRKYIRSAYQKMLDTCYPGLSEKDVQARYGDRLIVSPDLVDRDAPIFLFQNNHDTLHCEHHLAPLLEQIAPERRAEFTDRIGPETGWRVLNVVRYDDEELGHSPPRRSTMNEMITPLLAGPVIIGES